jgi:hypothetical protein
LRCGCRQKLTGHSDGVILEDSVAIEVFSPVRDDYVRDGCETA